MFPTPKNTNPASYTFGSIMVSVSKGEYKYGMNTQEKDNEIYGEGNSYSAEYWQYDARLGRRWNVDPRPNPSISKYACLGNNPIGYSDKFGDTVSKQLQLKLYNSREEANKLIDQIGDYKKKLTSLMVDGSDNSKLISGIDEANHAISELQSFLSKLNNIENDSERDYDIKVDNSYTTAGVLYTNGSITIVFPNLEEEQDISLLSHEIEHLYQYSVGKLNYNSNKNVSGISYDIFDEVDAYKTQWAFSFFGSFLGETDVKYNEIIPSNIVGLHLDYQMIWQKTELNRATIMTDEIAKYYSEYFFEGEHAKKMYEFLKSNYLGRPLGEFTNNIEK